MAIILSKAERFVMQSLYELAHGKPSVLVGLEDVMAKIGTVKKLRMKPSSDYDNAAALDETAATEQAEVYEHEKMENLVSADEKKKRAKKHWFSRKNSARDSTEAAAAIEPKTYVDEPPVRKGLMEYRKPVKYADLPHTLDILYMEDYIDLTEAVDSGEIKYIVKLLGRGQCWERDERDRKRNAMFKFALTLATPVASFVLGLLLRLI